MGPGVNNGSFEGVTGGAWVRPASVPGWTGFPSEGYVMSGNNYPISDGANAYQPFDAGQSQFSTTPHYLWSDPMTPGAGDNLLDVSVDFGYDGSVVQPTGHWAGFIGMELTVWESDPATSALGAQVATLTAGGIGGAPKPDGTGASFPAPTGTGWYIRVAKTNQSFTAGQNLVIRVEAGNLDGSFNHNWMDHSVLDQSWAHYMDNVVLTTSSPTDPFFLSVTPGNRDVGYASGSTMFDVANIGASTGMAWTTSESESWLSIAGGSGSDAGTFTVNYDTNTGAERVGTITVTASGAGGSPMIVTVTQEPVDLSLIGWYQFDETSGSTAVDSSGSGADGTITGAGRVLDSQMGWCLEFDGGDWVDIPATLTSSISDEVTIAFWQKGNGIVPGESTGEGFTFFEAATGSNVQLIAAGNTAIWWGAGQTDWDDFLSGYALVESQVNDLWRHWAFVKDARPATKRMQIWRNGVMIHDTWGAGTGTVSIGTSTTFTIGKTNRFTYADYKGRMSDLRIYNRVLSQTEIEDLVAEDADFLFVNQTAEYGLPTTINPGAGAAWGDYNEDGWTDLCANGVFYRNNSGTSFTMTGTGFGYGVFGDYDNDFYPDWFSYWLDVYRNLSGTGFGIVTLPTLPMTHSRTGCWADFNNDGFLDLYIAGFYDEGPPAGSAQPDAILTNNAGSSFTKTWQSPANNFTRGITACDFDEDGDQDIYVSNYFLGANRLWQNDGAGGLTNVAAAFGVAGDIGGTYNYGHTIGSAWGDLDEDGHIDLFVGNFRHDWGDGSQDFAKFFKNEGPAESYHFQLMEELDGADWQESYATPALGDYDNDGDLDLLFTTVYSGDNPVLFRNDGGWNFTDVTGDMGLGGLGQTYQSAWADFDEDGDLDVITGGKLFVNSGNSNSWLKIRLFGDGVNVNSLAIGAQVRIDLNGRIITRQVEAGTGESNQNDLKLHFGLGGQRASVTADVLWPNGEIQTVENIAVNQRIDIYYSHCEQADFTGDGDINYIDFAIMASQWGQLPGTPSADIAPLPGGDDFVDIQDLEALVNFWLQTGCQ